MTEALKGKSERDAQALFEEVHRLLTEAQPVEDATKLIGKLSVLMGVKEYPMRVKCATLAWHTLQAALNQSNDTVSTE